jgi:tellurite resistance protein TerC
MHWPSAACKARRVKEVSLRAARRVVVAVVGGTVTAIGVALIVLPGPAFLVIPLGLSILATEFVWAKHWLHRAKEMAANVTNKVKR